jgi:hypothetical protein
MVIINQILRNLIFERPGVRVDLSQRYLVGASTGFNGVVSKESGRGNAVGAEKTIGIQLMASSDKVIFVL